MIGPLMIGDSTPAAAGPGAGGAAGSGGVGIAEGAGGAEAVTLLTFPAAGAAGGAAGAGLATFAAGAAAGVEPATVPATDATPGGFAGGPAWAGDDACNNDVPHMPQKRLVVGFSLPQRGQRTEPPDPYIHSLRYFDCCMGPARR